MSRTGPDRGRLKMITRTCEITFAVLDRFCRPETLRNRRTAALRLLVVILGLIVGQAVLYGPSLIGVRILLPVDILAEPLIYIPRTAETEKSVLNDPMRTDLVYYYEPARQFAISELRAGRLPLWSPYEFAGVGCFRWNLSPPWLAGYLIASPIVLAWIQMFIALTAGIGAYAFFRRVMRLEFWPSAITAWCYPLTGAYVLWQGFWLPSVMCWLPWMLLAVDMTVRRPAGWGAPLLALLSGVVLLSGAIDIGGQVLMASGLCAVWCFVDQYAGKWFTQQSLIAIVAPALAWALGILASAWTLLPLAEYMQTGTRPVARSQGVEERPPVGLASLPQVVLPDMYGSTRAGSYRIGPDIFQESSAGAYAGLLATLFLAPLALSGRRHRSICILALVLGVAGLSWTLNVPVLVQLLRLPGLNLMSHNRFVFVTAFAILILAAAGLNLLWQGSIPRRWWFLAPPALLAAILMGCVYRTLVLPEPIATEIAAAVQQGRRPIGISTMEGVQTVQDSYRRSYAVAAAVAGMGISAWAWLWMRTRIPRWAFAPLAALLVGELLWFGFGHAADGDPALYYPRVPVLEQLAASRPGRVIGSVCLPPNLAATHGLRDVRGYDGVDPAQWVELLNCAADPRSVRLPYALTQWIAPKGCHAKSGGMKLSPILSMLNVRYVIYRGLPARGYHPAFQGADYFVWENHEALPRVYVPLRVETVANHEERLVRLSDFSFDPRQTAYIEQPVAMPAACQGSASITEETPQRVTVAADMLTPGLIVLSDRWDPGWKAYLDGKEVPILRANHAVRGVAVPAGRQVLQFRFEPATVATGFKFAGLAVLVWVIWVAVVGWRVIRRGVASYPPLIETGLPEEATTASSSKRLATTPSTRRERQRRGGH
jgi:hypothetical protein